MECTKSKNSPLLELPVELREQIFGLIDAKTAARVFLTCRELFTTGPEQALRGHGITAHAIDVIRQTHPTSLSSHSSLRIMHIWPTFSERRQPFSFYMRGEHPWTTQSVSSLIRLGTPIGNDTVLHAVSFGNVTPEVVDLLLSAKASWDPAELATSIASAAKQGKLPMVSVLLKHGAVAPDDFEAQES